MEEGAIDDWKGRGMGVPSLNLTSLRECQKLDLNDESQSVCEVLHP